MDHNINGAKDDFHNLLTLVYKWIFLGDASFEYAHQSGSALASSYIQSRANVRACINTTDNTRFKENGDILLTILSEKSTHFTTSNEWFLKIHSCLQKLYNSVKSELVFSDDDVTYNLYKNLMFYYGDSSIPPQLQYLFKFDGSDYGLEPVEIVSIVKRNDREIVSDIEDWKYSEVLERIHYFIRNMTSFGYQVKCITDTCDLVLNNTVPNIRNFGVSKIYNLNKHHYFNNMICKTLDASTFQCKKVSRSDDRLVTMSLSDVINTEVFKNITSYRDIKANEMLHWVNTCVSKENYLPRWLNLEDETITDDVNENNISSSDNNNDTTDSLDNNNIDNINPTDPITDERDTSEDLLQLDTGDTKSPLNDYIYRESIDHINRLLQRDENPPLSNDELIQLDIWCKKWLWLLDINDVKEFMGSFGLHKLISKKIRKKGTI